MCVTDDPAYQQNGHTLPPLEEVGEEYEQGYTEDEEGRGETREGVEVEEQPEQVTAGEEPRTKVRWQKVAAKSLDLAEDQPTNSEEQSGGGESGWNKIKKVRIQQTPPKRPSRLQLGSPTPKLIRVMKQAQSVYLREGESYQVWRPKKQLSETAEKLNQELKEETPSSPDKPTRQVLTPSPVSKSSLRSRQKTVFKRAMATQAVLKETTDELLNEADEEEEEEVSKPKLSLREASKRITANLRKQQQDEKGRGNISDVVSQYLAKMRADGGTDLLSSGGSGASSPSPLKQRTGTRRVAFADRPGAIELRQWKKFVRESKTQSVNADNWNATSGMSRNSARSKSQYPLHTPGTPKDHPDDSRTETGHKKVVKTSSDSSITKQVGFSDHSPQASPLSTSPGVDTEFTHRPLVKQDSVSYTHLTLPTIYSV